MMEGARESRRPGSEVRPAADVHRTPEGIEILVDVPGVERERLKLTARDNEVLLEARRPESEGEPVTSVRLPLRYRRRFRLPEAVDPDRIRATLEDGVLRLSLPSAERARPRTIPVESP